MQLVQTHLPHWLQKSPVSASGCQWHFPVLVGSCLISCGRSITTRYLELVAAGSRLIHSSRSLTSRSLSSRLSKTCLRGTPSGIETLLDNSLFEITNVNVTTQNQLRDAGSSATNAQMGNAIRANNTHIPALLVISHPTANTSRKAPNNIGDRANRTPENTATPRPP